MEWIVIEDFLKLFGNYFFPMCLSVYLIFRIDQIMTEMVRTQKDFSIVFTKEIKDIKQDILDIRLDMAKYNSNHIS